MRKSRLEQLIREYDKKRMPKIKKELSIVFVLKQFMQSKELIPTESQIIRYEDFLQFCIYNNKEQLSFKYLKTKSYSAKIFLEQTQLDAALQTIEKSDKLKANFIVQVGKAVT